MFRGGREVGRPGLPACALSPSRNAGGSKLRRLIVTGDDFGLAVEVNEAIELAHREGILTAASLMVGAPAAEDAVQRARRLPSLAVGLHVVVVRGRPVLPAEQIPDLVDGTGMLSTDLVGAGIRFASRPAAARQLESEIRAQFERFRQTGLALDHADAHNHMHFHPAVLRILIAVGRDYGLRAIRVPRESPVRSWRAARGGLALRLGASLFLRPWLTRMRRRVRKAGLISNDWVFGMNDDGRMDTGWLLRTIEELPEGVSEIGFHPAARGFDEADPRTRAYRRTEELAALTSPLVATALRRRSVERTTFGALAAGRDRCEG